MHLFAKYTTQSDTGLTCLCALRVFCEILELLLPGPF